jgi:hypothetical protein
MHVVLRRVQHFEIRIDDQAPCQPKVNLLFTDLGNDSAGDHVVDHERDLRVCLSESGDDLWQDTRSEGGQGGKAHDAVPPGSHVPSFSDNGIKVSHDTLEGWDQLSPHPGKGNGPRVSVEQAHTQGFLQIADLHCEGGLGEAQEAGGTREAAKLGHGNKGADLAEVRVHNRSLLL